MDDRAESSASLGELLSTLRHRLFVGRASECELFRSALTTTPPPFAVLLLHGPGGIGKSSLVEAFARIASGLGATVARLDGRAVGTSAADVIRALLQWMIIPDDGGPIESPSGQLVIMIDNFDRLAALGRWLREDLLPRLPADAIIVAAGRNTPDAEWKADPAWRELTRIIALRNLSPGDCHVYLAEQGVDPNSARTMIEISHGHPLGLSLITEVASRGGDIDDDQLAPDLVDTLLSRFVDTASNERQRQALAVCALARVTSEPLLRHVLDLPDAHALFEWLHGLSFVEVDPRGLRVHELARDVLDADLRWRDEEGYRWVLTRVREHLHDQLRRTRGPQQQRLVYDEKYVFRRLPSVLSPVDWEIWGDYLPEAATPDDRAPIMHLAESADGPQTTAAVAHWFARQPESFHVVRHPDGRFRGFITLLDLTRASDADLDLDVGARAGWDFACGQTPPRPGERVTQTRFILDTERGHAPSPTQNAAPVLTMQLYVNEPALSWDLLTMADPDRWNDYFALADLPRADGADFVMDAGRYGLFAHDFRSVSVDLWLDRVTEHALNQRPSAPDRERRVLVLSQAEFDDAVRQGLRDLHRPDVLARNPLVHTRLLGRPEISADAMALARMLREAVDALAVHPRDDKLYRAVERTFCRPSSTQEAAAAALGLPFSTYRRHLTQGVARVTAWLWDREVYGPAPGEQD